MEQRVETAPRVHLPTDKGVGKLILLTIVTLGIYLWFFYARIADEINLIASPHDGKKTMNYWLLLFIVGPFTVGIGYIVWMHKLSNRMGAELARRGIAQSFSASDYWIWYVLLSCIIVGPFIYLNKLCQASNLLNADYNAKG